MTLDSASPLRTVAWDPAFSVGDDEIDHQHRQLIDIINQLGGLISGDSAAGGDSAQTIFDRLADYVTSHFAYEEQRMIDAGYPVEKVDAHRVQHRRILRSLQDYESHLESGDPEVMKELLPFLYGDWLIHHICESDRDYAPYLARGVAAC